MTGVDGFYMEIIYSLYIVTNLTIYGYYWHCF